MQLWNRRPGLHGVTTSGKNGQPVTVEAPWPVEVDGPTGRLLLNTFPNDITDAPTGLIGDESMLLGLNTTLGSWTLG